MTEKAYLQDAYLRELDARVVRAEGEHVVLDRTLFYAEGGGQAADHGTLRWDGGECAVVDARHAGDDVIQTVSGPFPPTGSLVHCILDWDRRYGLMRHHTAVHVLSGVVWREYRAPFTGGQLRPDRARVDIRFGSEWNPELPRTLEALVNAELEKDLRVSHREIPREEFEKADLVRTAEDLVDPSLTTIRLTDIEGLDVQADGGTHVRSLAEVGRFRIVKAENKGKGHRRLSIELDAPA